MILWLPERSKSLMSPVQCGGVITKFNNFELFRNSKIMNNRQIFKRSVIVLDSGPQLQNS